MGSSLFGERQPGGAEIVSLAMRYICQKEGGRARTAVRMISLGCHRRSRCGRQSLAGDFIPGLSLSLPVSFSPSLLSS